MAGHKAPKPPPPSAASWRAWIIAGVVGVLSIAGISTVSLFQSTPGATLEQRVDAVIAREREQTPEARHTDVQVQIDELTVLQKDPAFAQLPKSKQDHVANRLSELQAYQQFQALLAQIPDPAQAQTEEQLVQTEASLSELLAPAKYAAEWSQTEPYRRATQWLAEARALAQASRETWQGYHQLLRTGRQVIADKDAPGLPRRAKAALDKARTLPGPKVDRDKVVPGAARATYGQVFQFARVQQVYADWEGLKKQLEPLAALDSP